MSSHTATVTWSRGEQKFTDGRYSRAHQWTFDGGATVPASSSPHSVPLPFSDPAGVDPEEAFVAALSSCHMLWFLHLAGRQGLVVESYEDEAVGVLEKNADGRVAMTVVTLRPRIVFVGTQPSAEDLNTLHHRAHEECYIANSVTTEVRCEPRM